MKNMIFLILSALLFLSGCSENKEQPASQSPAVETTPAPLDSKDDEAQQKPETAVSPEIVEPTEAPSKELGQSKQDQPQSTEKNTALPAKEAETGSPPPKKPQENQPAVPTPAAKPAAAAPTPLPVQEKKAETVLLSIRGDEQVGLILAATEVNYLEGDTVIKVLARTLKEKKIPMEYSGTGPTSYVQGIANLYEFDRGPLSGWMFRVNGAFPSLSAGSVKLQPGDKIEWLYTLDLGKDVGDKNR